MEVFSFSKLVILFKVERFYCKSLFGIIFYSSLGIFIRFKWYFLRETNCLNKSKHFRAKICLLNFDVEQNFVKRTMQEHWKFDWQQTYIKIKPLQLKHNFFLKSINALAWLCNKLWIELKFDAILIMCLHLLQGVEVRTCLLQCQPVPLPPHRPRQRLLHARHHQPQQQWLSFIHQNPDRHSLDKGKGTNGNLISKQLTLGRANSKRFRPRFRVFAQTYCSQVPG